MIIDNKKWNKLSCFRLIDIDPCKTLDDAQALLSKEYEK
jgi:hypothetical protein